MQAFFPLLLCLIRNSAMPSPSSKPAAEMSFETAMERLEAIVNEMESGKMRLEDLLARYEEGMKLVKLCQDRLAKAEQKIEIITRDHAGKTMVKNFVPTEATNESSATSEVKDNRNEDVSLF
jgi:exodeoxyribonuclease VII small subunit